MGDRPHRAPPLGVFLEDLARRLDALGPEGVRAAIECRAASLRPTRRNEFLALFGSPVAATPMSELDGDIDDFLEAVDERGPDDRWGDRYWDDDEGGASVDGDVAEELLVAVGERFLAGDIAWATTAYERLLAAVTGPIDDDRGFEVRVDVDLAAEARNRLVWGLAQSDGAVEESAEAIVGVLDHTDLITHPVTFDDLLGAHPGGGSLSGEVLRAVAARIVAELGWQPGWYDKQRLGLALEIRTRFDGVEAVIDAARAGGPSRLGTYLTFRTS